MNIIQTRQFEGHTTSIETNRIVDWNAVCREAAQEISKWFYKYVDAGFSSVKPTHYLRLIAMKQLKLMWL